MLKRKSIKNLKRKNRFIIFFLCFTIFLAINGCKDDNPKPVKVHFPIKIKKKIKKKKIKQKSNKVSIKKEKFNYIYHNERDPFIPFFAFKQETPVEEEDIPRTPLTTNNLSQYKLKAIMWRKGKKPIAMVETEDKLGLFFSIGDYIGSELFKVVEITPETVVLEKKTKGFLNNIKVTRKVMTIENEGE